MKNDFVTWLNDEIKQRGWSNSELARRADVVPSTISMILSREKTASNATLRGIARALNVPTDRVFVKAGELPPHVIGRSEEDELLSYYRTLNEHNRRALVATAKALREQQTEYNTGRG